MTKYIELESAQKSVFEAARTALGYTPSLENFPTEQECMEDFHSCVFAVKTQSKLEYA